MKYNLSVVAPEMDCHLSDLFYENVANVCCAMHIRSNKYNEKRLLMQTIQIIFIWFTIKNILAAINLKLYYRYIYKWDHFL